MKSKFRVISDTGTQYVLCNHEQTFLGQLAGRFFQQDRPVVGDWVWGRLQDGGWVYIEERIERTSLLSRRIGPYQKQDLAANVDLLLVVAACGRDLNLNRLERYLALAAQNRIHPLIVLNKVDTVENADLLVQEMKDRLPGTDILPISAERGDGVNDVIAYFNRALEPGGTIAMMGSSGVGKSTLVNRITGENLPTQAIRDFDERGRHTTTHRSLRLLESGHWLMDTPGIRLLNPEYREGVAASFQDIEELAPFCRFRDCQHQSEPGCAVQAAVEEGRLDEGRYLNYLKLRRQEGYQRKISQQLEWQGGARRGTLSHRTGRKRRWGQERD